MPKNTYKPFMATDAPDLRDVDMSDWGLPQVNTQSAVLANDSDPNVYRMARPNWAPGEFEEWKQGHITGLGTEYGRNAQRAYKMRHFPGLQDMIQQGADNAARVEAGDVGPNSTAFMDLLSQFRR